MNIPSRFWWWLSLALLLVMTPSLATISPSRTKANVQALVAFGPRVAGTPAVEQASAYLIEEYRRAGYATEIGTFTYQRNEDLGSTLMVAEQRLAGRALSGSPAGQMTAPLVAVPSVGRPTDFAKVDVRGAIAIVRRGEIPFFEKARNAKTSGAVGLVIVNSEPGELRGTLVGAAEIPVLALSGDRGQPLLAKARTQKRSASLAVNTASRTITGRNVIAHLPNVARPSILLGGHYDSVPGSPGANDNASGTAVVLEIARRFAGTPVANSAWFVAFDGEEDGLRGSAAFVKAAGSEFLGNLKAMLNFDMVAINDKLLVGGNKQITGLAQKVDRKITSIGDSGRSDHHSFATAGVPVIFFYRGQDPNYHSPGDTKADPKLMDETVQVAQSLVRELLEAHPAQFSDGS